MAIQLNLSKLDKKREAILDPANTTPLERGMMMIYSGVASADGTQMVKPAAGAGGEVFAGVLWLSETSQVDVPQIDVADIPALAPLTVTLTFTPIAFGNLLAVRTDTGAAITVVAGAPGAGQLGLTGKVLTADAALAGLNIQVNYRYAISAAELARRGGRRSVNQGGEALFSQVTLCTGALRIYVSNFVTSDPFDPVTNKVVLMAASGRVGTTGGGVAIGQVIQVPQMLQSPGIRQAFVGIEVEPPAGL